MEELRFKEFVDAVKEKVDIAEVVRSRVSLNEHNKALCPFHNEKTPSFSVNEKGQYFYCFGCGVGGDVFTFLMRYEKKTFIEVLADLAGNLGISMPTLSEESKAIIEEGQLIGDVLNDTVGFYQKNLGHTPMGVLMLRGIQGEAISRFRIGFARGGLLAYLKDQRGYPLDLCIKAGVLRTDGQGNVADYFYNRIILPNIKNGRVVHISARNIDDQKPRYIHLPCEMHYLYNEDALRNKEIYITEGVFDCLSLVQAGYAAVATQGTALKEEHFAKFDRAEKIFLCMDNDDAGLNASLNIGALLGEKARIVLLPKGQDVNDYFQEHSKKDFEKLLSEAKNIIQYELLDIPADTDKTQLPDKLAPVLKQLARMDKAKAEAYLNYDIKKRFNLKGDDIKGYRDMILRFRKDNIRLVKEEEISVEGNVYTASFESLVDIVEYEGQPAFFVTKEGFVDIELERKIEGVTYCPPPKDQIPWLLPSGERIYAIAEAIGNDKELLEKYDHDLFEELIAHHKSISELPSEDHYILLAAWDMHTYLLEQFQYSPIICLYSVPERGKSRTGKGMIYLAFHGIHAESLRDPYLVRVANNFEASIFFDVKDIWRKAERNESEDVLLHRFEKGAKVPRVLYPDRGPYQDIVYFKIFGPTIIATNEGVHRILETRAIQINMPETSRRYENDVTPESALALKERLILFRSLHLGNKFPEITKPARGRLGDILKPLHQIILHVCPEREKQFLNLVKIIEAQRLIEKADSLEAEIISVLRKVEDKVVNGLLSVKDITDEFNRDRQERTKITYHKVGRRLSAMGFEKGRSQNGGSGILWDESLITHLFDRYGLNKTSVTPASSDNDVTDVSGVSREVPVERDEHGIERRDSDEGYSVRGLF